MFRVWLLPGLSLGIGCAPLYLTQQTPNKCWSTTAVRILENNSAGTSSQNRLNVLLRTDAGPGATSGTSQTLPERGLEPDPPGTACGRHAARNPTGSHKDKGPGPAPRQRRDSPPDGQTPAAAPRASACGRAFHFGRRRRPGGTGRAGGPRAHPLLRLQLGQPLLPQSLQFLLRHSATVRMEQPQAHRGPLGVLPQPPRESTAFPTAQAPATPRHHQSSPELRRGTLPGRLESLDSAIAGDRAWGGAVGKTPVGSYLPVRPHLLSLSRRPSLAGITWAKIWLRVGYDRNLKTSYRKQVK